MAVVWIEIKVQAIILTSSFSEFVSIDINLRHLRTCFNPFKRSVLFMGHRQTEKKLDQKPQNAASDQVLHSLLTE